jgi:hypothetical protein
MAAPQPGRQLHFREQHERQNQRVDQVGREIHLQAIQAEQPAERDREREMKPDERRAADEDAQSDRARLTRPAAALGAQHVDQALQPGRRAGAGDGRRLGHEA